MPIAASAAGLGKMTVMSGLGEPLSAEIEIAASKEELSSLSARIAPSEIYAEQSIERAASLSSVRVELTKRSDGTSVLKLSSPQPVNDPFLDMLIQVDWPTGRLLREYTALLDPPGYGDRAAASAQEAAVDGKQLPTVAAPTKKNAAKSVSRAVSAPKTEPSEETADTYVTKRGDTLRNVARQMQVDDVTLEQMLVGLFQANRSAFVADNMNQLKVGQIMRKPREEELRAISPQDALQEVRIHTSNWNAYRSDVAQAVAQSQGAPAESQPQSSGGKITAQAEDKAAPPPAGPRDVVKLSKSEATGAQKTAAAGTGSGAADDKLRALEEESTSQDKAIAEVNERIAFFEKQIQDMQKLLLIQNQILAELQKGNAAGQPPAAEPAPAPTQPQDAQQPPAQVEQAKPEPAKPAPAPAPAPEEPATGNLLDDLLQNPVMLGAAGGVLALLLGGWLLLRRQRQKNLDNFEKGILTSSGLKTDTVFGTTGGAAVDTGETSFMTDFAHRNDNGMIDTSDVDPVSEAEVYMAYGRDAQAEEILKDAITKEPKRYELHTKLLEIYANRKDATAFETLAGELYATLGTTDPVWGKVAELGRALEPENPMYASAAESSGISAAGAVAAAGVVAAAVASTVPEAQAEESVAEESQDNSLDFDLGMLAADESAPEANLEKEIESAESEPLPDLEAFSEPVAEEVAVSAEMPEEGMDLQFDLPEPAAAGVAQLDASDLGLPEETAPAAEQVEEISFDLPELALDEVSTQMPDEASAIDKAEEEPLAGDFSLPELAAVETAVEPPAEAVEEISFDLPELAPASEEPAVELEAASDAVEPAVPEMEMPAFDLELPSESGLAPTEPAGEAMVVAETPDFELPEIALPEASAEVAVMDEAAVPEEAPVAEEIVFEEPAKEEESALDFNFSMDSEAAAPVEAAELPAAPIPDLDLSGISLDIAETAGDASETAAEEEITLSSGDESADVDTKLDLVTAYMDMGDSEGARELLEEVLQEGGPKQRERAQKMLDALT